MFVLKKQFSGPYISRTIRFNQDLYRELHLISERNHVSINIAVQCCCQFALESVEDSEHSGFQPVPKKKK